MDSEQGDSTRKEWLLYDGGCGFCRTWVEFWKPTLVRLGYEVSPLQSEGIAARFNISESELTDDLRLILQDGSQIRGADVYRCVMRRLWWAYPFYLLSKVPLINILFDWSYRKFADNRHLISKSCKLS